MFDVLISIIINLISSPIAFIAGIIYKKILVPIGKYQNVLLKILPFNLQSEDKIVLTYGYVLPETTSNYMIEEGDLIALFTAKELISSHYSEQNFLLQDSITIANDLSSYKNIFSLSGPKWNKITEYYLGQIGSPATFSKKPKGVAVKTSRMHEPLIYETLRKEGQLATTCYGIIIGGRLNVNDTTEKNILICSGRTTLSTNGCLLFLRQLSRKSDFYEELKKRGLFKAQKKWGILLKVESQFMPKIDINRPLRSNDVKIQIVNVYLEEDFLQPYEYSYQ